METNQLIEELNLFWMPIRPHLARRVEALYSQRDLLFVVEGC
jgi:hypothetical protein